MQTNKQGMIIAGGNLIEARATALKVSKAYPGKYITLYSCFGAYVSISDRLNVNAPGDSFHHSYWLNGKEKPFTESQIIQDQIHTPTMS